MARKHPSPVPFAEAVEAFRLFGDPSRLRIVLRLLDGELSVGDLCQVAGQSQTATSHHLMLLRMSGLVECRRDGKRVVYRVGSPHVARLLRDVGRE